MEYTAAYQIKETALTWNQEKTWSKFNGYKWPPCCDTPEQPQMYVCLSPYWTGSAVQ